MLEGLLDSVLKSYQPQVSSNGMCGLNHTFHPFSRLDLTLIEKLILFSFFFELAKLILLSLHPALLFSVVIISYEVNYVASNFNGITLIG